jgi:hypothetical protein
MVEWGQVQYGGMDKDMHAKDPRRNQFYYDGQNITLVFNRELSRNIISNERGNKLIVTLPNVFVSETFTDINTHATATTYNESQIGYIQKSTYGSKWATTGLSGTLNITAQTILGGGYLNENLYIISTDDTADGHLLIWEINYDEDFVATTTLKFLGLAANMSTASLVNKFIGIYENSNVQKLYWIDGGRNQMRVLNLAADDTFNIHVKTLNATPEWDYVSPTITDSLGSGGEWSGGAGMVQYGYKLFNKYGSSTKMSPLSFTAPITKDYHGVPSGESGNCTLDVTISSVDNAFEYIQVYRFFHDDSTAYNTQCHLIYEAEIDFTDLTFKDIGDSLNISLIGDITNLLTTPSGPHFPRTMEFKDNRIFIGNLGNTFTDVDYDTRAYMRNSSGNAYLTDVDGNVESSPYHDAINPYTYTNPGDANYNTYRRQSDGSTYGAEGTNVVINEGFESIEPRDYFKYSHNYQNAGYQRNEVYRYGIQFFDKFGTALFVNWVIDYRMNRLWGSTIYSSGMLDLKFPEFTLKNLNTLDSNIYSFRIVRVETTPEDRMIKSQGLLNSSIFSYSGRSDASKRNTYMANYMLRTYKEDATSEPGTIYDRDFYTTSNLYYHELNAGSGQYSNKIAFLRFFSPETIYAQNLLTITEDDSIEVVAGIHANINLYYKEASNTDSYTNLSPWTNLYYNLLPNASNNVKYIYNNSDEAGIERFGWIMHQRATYIVNGSLASGDVIFRDIDEVAVMERNSSETTLGGTNKHINNFSLIGNLDLTDNLTQIPFIGAAPYSYLLSLDGAELSDTIDTYPEVVNDGETAERFYLLTDIWNDVTTLEAYGGKGYQNRLKNKYIPCSEVQVIGTNTTISNVRAYQGDCFTQLFKFVLNDYIDFEGNNMDPEFFSHDDYDGLGFSKPGASGDTPGFFRTNKCYVEIPVQSRINLRLADENLVLEDHLKFESSYAIMPNYNPVYHRQNNYLKGVPKPFTFNASTQDTTLTRYSDVNIAGSFQNGHTTFQVVNQANVDLRFGAITSFHVMNETLFVVQQRGVGYWSISPSAVTSTSAGNTSLGKGDVLHNYVIVSNTYGSNYNFGAIVGEKGLYVLDLYKKKFLRVLQGEQGLSDFKGIHALLLDLPKDITDSIYANGTGVSLSYDTLTYNVYINILYDGTDSGGGSIPSS